MLYIERFSLSKKETFMNRIRLNTFVFSLFIAMVLLNSCETALTTSWGTAFKRDPNKVSVTASNVNDLLKSARGDTELSKAIFDKTVEKAKNSSGEEKAVLQTAAITAAKQAAALDLLVMGNIGTILNADSDTKLDGQDGLLEQILEGAKGNHIKDISTGLGDMFSVGGDDVSSGSDIYIKPPKENPGDPNDPNYTPPDPDEPSPGPHFTPGPFTETVTDTDLVNLIITIMLGKAAGTVGGVDAYLNLWKPEAGPNAKTVEGGNLDSEETVAIAAYNLLKEKGQENELYKALEGILEG
jgi:hypothetical protein